MKYLFEVLSKMLCTQIVNQTCFSFELKIVCEKIACLGRERPGHKSGQKSLRSSCYPCRRIPLSMPTKYAAEQTN